MSGDFMKNIINVTNLTKKYNLYDEYVLKNFNYSFHETGFYVLFGPSGCGKTTLLNILYGLTEYENGGIELGNEKYINKIPTDVSESYMAYLTQENYFVDYLTVKDNIELCSDNEEKINKLLKKFKLEDKINLYPKNLSGGEKQRLSLLQALLKQKKIILLDEPTASLDPANKTLIFELLMEMKDDVLIICASHDSKIFEYCDNVIEFDKIEKYTLDDNKIGKILNPLTPQKQKPLVHYMMKQNDKKTVRSKILILLIFLFSFMLCYFCFDIKGKLVTTIQNKYKVNYLTVYCPINTNSCESLFKNENIVEYNYVYSLNVPLATSVEVEEGFVGNLNYETSLVTLPANKNNFPLVNKILFGHYIMEKNQIMLGYELAMELSNGDIDKLIDSDIVLKLPDGEQKFVVAGVFNNFTDIDAKYFQSGEIDIENINNKYFISGEYTKKYLKDDVLGYNEISNSKLVYYVYFNDFNELYNVNKRYSQNIISGDDIYVSSFPSQYLDFMNQFRTFSLFIYPIVFLSIIIAMIFYFQTMVLDINYNIHIIGVYQFYGYSLAKIKKGLILNNIINISKCFACSFFISFVLSFLLNKINTSFNLFNYELFNVNFPIVLVMYIITILISIIMSIYLCKSIKKNGWYRIVKNGGDLI
jgi:hemin transport system ATP-binding protein